MKLFRFFLITMLILGGFKSKANGSLGALYLQYDTTLGILNINSSFLPSRWTGVGEMGAGWEERAMADVNGDGVPDIIFQNGTQLGALIMGANGAPVSWIGIGNLDAGWELRAAADINGDGRPELIFQNGTLLGYLTINTSGQPLAWSGIGSMGSGWELCAAGDLTGAGQPELLFQSGEAIGALEINTSGLPVAWHGIGAMSSGWHLGSAVDLNGDGHADLVFQNGTVLGALEIDASFLPTVWHGIGALGSGWSLPDSSLVQPALTGNFTEAQATGGEYAFDWTVNHSLWQEVTRDSSGNITGTSGLIASSTSAAAWVELQYNPATGLPSAMNFSTGVQLNFTSIDTVNQVATTDFLINGSIVASAVQVPIEGILTGESATNSIRRITEDSDSGQDPLVTYTPDLVLMLKSALDAVADGALPLGATLSAATEFGIGLLTNVALDLAGKEAQGTPGEVAIDSVKTVLSSSACFELFALGTPAAVPSLGLAYIPALIACSNAYSDAEVLSHAVATQSSDAIAALQGSELIQAYQAFDGLPLDPTEQLPGDSYSYDMPAPGFFTWLQSVVAPAQQLAELQSLDPDLPDDVSGINSQLDSILAFQISADSGDISFIETYDPGSSSLIPALQSDLNACMAAETNVDLILQNP